MTCGGLAIYFASLTVDCLLPIYYCQDRTSGLICYNSDPGEKTNHKVVRLGKCLVRESQLLAPIVVCKTNIFALK